VLGVKDIGTISTAVPPTVSVATSMISAW